MSRVLANGPGTAMRRELDFYPTPPEVTEALLRFFDWPVMRVWEPACGDGAMSRVIASHGHEVISTDLRETGFGHGGVDFLKASMVCDAIITNPPFNLSSDFIAHALTQAPIVAMVLKSQYWHARSREALFRKHQPAWVLPLTWRPNFLGKDGGSPTMEVHWTVWLPHGSFTRYKPLNKPQGSTP